MDNQAEYQEMIGKEAPRYKSNTSQCHIVYKAKEAIGLGPPLLEGPQNI